MNILIYFFLTINIFCTENVLLLCNVSDFSMVNNVEILFALIIFICSNSVVFRANKSFGFLFTVLLLLHVVCYAITGYDGFKSTMCIGALFIAGAMPSPSIKNKYVYRGLFYVFLSFYLIECSLAIIERIVSRNLPVMRVQERLWEGLSSSGEVSFRSEALLGHPLQNALIVSSAMSFILVSNIAVSWKFGLWGLGFLSLLCFNTRFAIVFSVVLIFFYLVKHYRNGFSKDEKLKVCIIFWGGLFVFIYLFFTLGLGDRLLRMGLMDDSSAFARVAVFDIFLDLDIKSLLLPVDSNVVASLMSYRGVRVIENFWVVFLFNYGFLFLLIIVVFYFLILSSLYKHYTSFSVLFTASAFFITASTNNSLVTSWHMLAYYFYFLILFNPKMQPCVLPKKMYDDSLVRENKILYFLKKKV